jgi:predicted N-acetyltransferase YhbS
MSHLRMVKLGPLTDEDWAELTAGEHEPFGPIGHTLEWRPKERHLAVRGGDGRLAAAGGVLVATVHAGDESFDVVGVGSLIVTPSLRGTGLMWSLVEPLLRLAEELGPERAMLFCREELVPLYERAGFMRIAAPVRADQPGGRIEMPLAAMWRALRAGVGWPPGPVEVEGLPF